MNQIFRYVGMMELADMTDSKSVAEKRVGSSPTTDTKHYL